jgi:hypothetical protein
MYDLDGHLEMDYEDRVSGPGTFDASDWFDDVDTYGSYFDEDDATYFLMSDEEEYPWTDSVPGWDERW